MKMIGCIYDLENSFIKMYFFFIIINLYVIDVKYCNGILLDFIVKEGDDCLLKIIYFEMYNFLCI